MVKMINVTCILPPKQPKQKKNAQKHCTVAVTDLNEKKNLPYTLGRIRSMSLDFYSCLLEG